MSDEQEQLIKTPGPLGSNFILERELGRGGMGGVYLGRDIMLDRPVAVKVMQKEYGEDAEFLAKFKKEAQAAAKLIHPNIAQIYSYGVVDNMPYIAMELVAGGSLQQVMSNSPDGKPDVPRILKICEQVAQALRCAADQGLVHGDIKPENILLDANGNAKLVDFGLAGMQKDTSEIWGTPYYIAPEKLKKEPVDYRADMYNLGGTLYHALTGVAPFEGPDAAAVVRKRFEGRPKKPSEIRPELTPAIDELVLKMLEVNKADRYPTFEALLQAFKDVMTTGLTVRTTVKAESAGAKSSGKKLNVRTVRRMTTMKTLRKAPKIKFGGGGATGEGAADENGEAEAAEEPKSSVKKGRRLHLDDSADSGEEESNVGKKFALGIVGGIAIIGALAGGIGWYVVADKQARAEEKRNSIVKNITNAKQAIFETCRIAEKFGRDFESFAARATEECENATKKIAEAVPEFKDRLKPEPSQELLDAIAMTNAPVVAASETNTASVATNAVAGAAATNSTVAADSAKPPRFRPPTGDETDPNSPEGAEYLRLKAEFESGKANVADNTEAEQKPEPVPEKPAEEEGETVESLNARIAETQDPVVKLELEIKKLELQLKKCEGKFHREIEIVGEEAVTDVNDLWNRAYSCQASVIKIKFQLEKVFEAAKKAEQYTENTEPNMYALGSLSGEVKELYDGVKGSKDVENVQKGITYIKSKGAKSLKQTTDNLFRRRAETDRETKKLQYQIERLRAERQSIVDRIKLVADERQQSVDKFDAILQNKNFELLEWDAALKQLEFMKSNFKSPEGQIAAEEQMKKVRNMKFVQEVLVRNLKGYHFTKSKLFKVKAYVREADMKEIKLSKPDRDSKRDQNFKINWVKFYKDYHANFNELIIHYIENGRKNGSPKMTLQEWGDAMCGAALTLKLICSDDPAAATRGEQLAKDVAKNFPSYVKTLRMMFPDITFEESEE